MVIEKAVHHQESKITILTLLKNYYDNEVFYALIREIYNSELLVSLAAINASASLGNEIAIPHIYEVIEKGRPRQAMAGIKALAEIKAPSTVPRLLEYYDFFKNDEIQLEILNALDVIDPGHEKIIELNKRVVQNPYIDAPQKKIVVQALVDAEEFQFLERHLSTLPQAVSNAVFLKVLESKSGKVPAFLRSFLKEIDSFPPPALGCYLAAYQAATRQSQQSFVLKKLNSRDRKILVYYLLAITKYGDKISQPLQVFRTLLVVPYINQNWETVTGDSLKKLITNVEETAGFLLNEMAIITKTHLNSTLAKVKSNYISRNSDDKKDKLLMKIFAHLLENYGTIKIVNEVKDFFKSNNNDRTVVSTIVSGLKKQFAGAGEEERKILKACFPLFRMNDTTARMEMLTWLNKIDLHRPMLLRRLNRLVRVAGALGMRITVKKVVDVLRFAREEHNSFLEETCIVTLCQLYHRTTIEQAGRYLQYPDTPSFKGYIRGAGYLPSTIIIDAMLDLLSRPILDNRHREVIMGSIEQMNHQNIRNTLEKLLRITGLRQIPARLKERIGSFIMTHPIAFLFPMFIDFIDHTDESVKCIALKAIRKIVQSGEKLPPELLVNKLYRLLNEGSSTLKKQVLLTLICLEDDYAKQVFTDYLEEHDEQTVADIIEQFEPPLSHDIMMLLLSLVWQKSGIIQKALRNVVSRLITNGYSEEIRNTLLDYLKRGTPEHEPLVKEPVYPDRDTLVSQAKKEYKFKRENNQLVTVMFLDMAGYTEKSSDKDALSLMNLISRFEELVTPVIIDYKGDIIKKMGDGILAVFKNPLNACFAALMIQERIKDKNTFTVEKDKFEVRIGMNTGEVIRKEGDVYGDVVNVASRMETAANPGDILLTQSTYNEIKEYIQCTHLGNINVKGKKQSIPAYTARKMMANTLNILKESRKMLDKYAKNKGKNTLTVLTESLFTPDFSVPATVKENKHLLRQVGSIFNEITRLGEEITHDYYVEYTFKRFVQEKWDALLAALKVEKKAGEGK